MGRSRSKRGVRVDAIMKERLAASPSGAGDVNVWSALAEALLRPKKDSGLWDLLDERTDPARLRPKLADDIEVKHFPLRWGNHYAMVANPRAMLFFRLEPWEANLLELMDGTRTVADIIVERLGGAG